MSDNAVTRRLQRVFSMSGDEFATRSRQEIGKRIDGLLGWFGHDFSQSPRISTRTPKFFFSSDEVPTILELLQQRLPDEYNQIVPRAKRICAHRFDLLGYRDLDYGNKIDWSLDRVHNKRAPQKAFYKIGYLDFSQCGDVKVTWELNRHQYFLTLAKACRITGEQRFAGEIFAQWEQWDRENPYPCGVNWASSLEFAFRSLSWLWTYYLLGDAAVQRPGFREIFLRSISVQGRAIERYLSTYFSPNTHLLGEAVGLFFIGVLCPELPSAERWKHLGWTITLQEAQRQVRPDGLHFEQSLYYHVYAVDFFLHARILAARNGISIPAEYDETIERMLEALAVLGRTGSVPRIGDDDGGRLFDGQRNRTEHMLDPLATGAVLHKRGDFKTVGRGLREETLWLLGPEAARTFDSLPEAKLEPGSRAFADSGLYVINDSDRQIVIDAGPLGAGSGGHGHADALSICISDQNGPVLIDSGTFEYVGDGGERSHYRTAAAHNTVTVDGVSQPHPRGPFAWSHHPKSTAQRWISGRSFDFFAGSHDAYEKLDSPVLHRRLIFALKQGFWLVRDVAAGTGEHKLDIYWHVAPEFKLKGGNRFARENGELLEIITPEGSSWSRQIEVGSWSPVYGQMQSAPVLHFSTVASLPTEFVTLFRLADKPAELPGVLTHSGPSAVADEYVYLEGSIEHQLFFAKAESWKLGHWESDADLVYWGWDRRCDRALLICCGGTKATFGGQSLVEYAQGYCEVVWENGKTQVLGPDSISASISAFRSLTDERILSDVSNLATERMDG